MQKTANEVLGAIVVLNEERVGEERCLVTRCANFEAYQKLPMVVRYSVDAFERQYAKTGWNSDTNQAYYKTGNRIAFAV